MLELPGLTSSGDLGKDLDGLKRYIARLVPALEMELVNAKQDDYQEQYSAQTQGVGAARTNSTAGALVAHELRYDNPHRVTAAQLGLGLEKLVSISFTTSGMTVRIGEKRGLQINVQDVAPTYSSWTQVGSVESSDEDLGDWEAEIPVLYAVIPVVRARQTINYWAGGLSGSTGKHIGTLRIHRGCQIEVGEDGVNYRIYTDEQSVPMTMIGMGVYGYGD